mgnify:CR=1 FL=1
MCNNKARNGLNKENDKTLSDLTNYKKIYESTYWGGFCISCNDIGIVDNRNAFINDYNIKKQSSRILKNIQEFIKNLMNGEFRNFSDHIEVYEDNNKDFVIITSPYNTNDDDTNFKNATGFKQIYNLYNNSARTYIKIMDRKFKHEKTNCPCFVCVRRRFLCGGA